LLRRAQANLHPKSQQTIPRTQLSFRCTAQTTSAQNRRSHTQGAVIPASYSFHSTNVPGFTDFSYPINIPIQRTAFCVR